MHPSTGGANNPAAPPRWWCRICAEVRGKATPLALANALSDAENATTLASMYAIADAIDGDARMRPIEIAMVERLRLGDISGSLHAASLHAAIASTQVVAEGLTGSLASVIVACDPHGAWCDGLERPLAWLDGPSLRVGYGRRSALGALLLREVGAGNGSSKQTPSSETLLAFELADDADVHRVSRQWAQIRELVTPDIVACFAEDLPRQHRGPVNSESDVLAMKQASTFELHGFREFHQFPRFHEFDEFREYNTPREPNGSSHVFKTSKQFGKSQKSQQKSDKKFDKKSERGNLGKSERSPGRPDSAHPKFRTKPCRHFINGTCFFGESCTFIH